MVFDTLIKVATVGERDGTSLGDLDFRRLKIPRQWSAPLQLPLPNRSRWHSAMMAVVNLLGLNREAEDQTYQG